MDDRLIAPIVGGVLFVMGVVMIRSHVLAWQREKHDPALEDADRNHFYARYRRRMQTSGLLVALGILIPGGDSLLVWLAPQQNAPPASKAWFAIVTTVYWAAVLLLVVWLIVMAMGDLLAMRAHSRASLARIRRKQRQLEEELARMKSRGSNGRKPLE